MERSNISAKVNVRTNSTPRLGPKSSSSRRRASTSRTNLPPSAGTQFSGHVKIDGASGQMTMNLRERAEVTLLSTTLDPKLG